MILAGHFYHELMLVTLVTAIAFSVAGGHALVSFANNRRWLRAVATAVLVLFALAAARSASQRFDRHRCWKETHN